MIQGIFFAPWVVSGRLWKPPEKIGSGLEAIFLDGPIAREGPKPLVLYCFLENEQMPYYSVRT